MAIARTSAKTGVLKVALYARGSTHDQQTLPMQLSAVRAYAKRRGWKVQILRAMCKDLERPKR